MVSPLRAQKNTQNYQLPDGEKRRKEEKERHFSLLPWGERKANLNFVVDVKLFRKVGIQPVYI